MECYCGEGHSCSYEDALEELTRGADMLASLIENATEEELGGRPGSGQPSAGEIVSYVRDAELVASIQYRLMLVDYVPDLLPFDPKRWAECLGPNQDIPSALDLVRLLRADNVRLLREVDRASRRHEGWHPEYGSITLEALVIHSASQAMHYLDQLRENLSTVRSDD